MSFGGRQTEGRLNLYLGAVSTSLWSAELLARIFPCAYTRIVSEYNQQFVPLLFQPPFAKLPSYYLCHFKFLFSSTFFVIFTPYLLIRNTTPCCNFGFSLIKHSVDFLHCVALEFGKIGGFSLICVLYEVTGHPAHTFRRKRPVKVFKQSVQCSCTHIVSFLFFVLAVLQSDSVFSFYSFRPMCLSSLRCITSFFFYFFYVLLYII